MQHLDGVTSRAQGRDDLTLVGVRLAAATGEGSADHRSHSGPAQPRASVSVSGSGGGGTTSLPRRNQNQPRRASQAAAELQRQKIVRVVVRSCCMAQTGQTTMVRPLILILSPPAPVR